MCARPEKGQTYIGIYILLVLLHTLHSYRIAGVTKVLVSQKLIGTYNR